MVKNIALSGKICSGKSLIAKYLQNSGYKIVSFASPMKEIAELSKATDDSSLISSNSHRVLEMMLSMDPFNGSRMFSLWASLKNKYQEEIDSGGKPREFLQELGSELKSVKSTCFVNYLLDTTYSGYDYVCDDMRLVAEADALKENGWLLVRCEVNEEVRKSRCLHLYNRFGEEQNHITETDLDDYFDWDYVFDTGYSKEYVLNRVDEMIEYFVKGK